MVHAGAEHQPSRHRFHADRRRYRGRAACHNGWFVAWI